MNYCLISNTSDCKNCYKCIRHCPIKAISFENDRASIIHEDCILCGTCYNVCPQDLKVIRNDLEKVHGLIRYSEKVFVSLAPSFIAYYPEADITTMRKALQKLGFTDVEETAVGATIVKSAYDEMLDDDHDIIISSCCHSVNTLIKRYYPDCLPYLADVLSPMQAHGLDIKKRYGNDAKVVFIGPCIAKKDEADRHPEYIDAVLTFEELDRWLSEKNEAIEEVTSKEAIEKSKARLFPTTGGVLRTMKKANPAFSYMAIDGTEEVIRTLEDIREGKIHKCFIEMSTCHGSCVNGPIIVKKQQSIVTGTLSVNRFAGKEDFDFTATTKEIKHVYVDDSVHLPMPEESQIEETLIRMGKKDPRKRLNCGSCGYDSCREKAIAIIRGKAKEEMCLPFLMEKATSLSDNIVSNTPNGVMVLDEDLNIQLINDTMCHIVGNIKAQDVIKTQVVSILDPFDYLDALDGKSVFAKKEYLSEYDRYVENTIVHDDKFNVLICIMRDITKEEVAKQKQQELMEKTLSITDDVLSKNMMTVHEIASLLGETAAQTKVALTSLKDTIKNHD